MSEVYDSSAETLDHIREVQGNVLQVITILSKSVKNHDASKLLSPEKEMFDTWTPHLKGTTYGSPEYKEALEKMRIPLRHHYDMNRHHPEHFFEGVAGMNLMDIVEMFCDWLAATKRHADGDIYKSIDQNQKRFEFSDDFRNIFINTARRMQNE